MSYSLFIDVATERGFIALYENGCLIHLKSLPFGLNNSAHLLPNIQEGFQATGLSPQKLSFIGVGVGPGSYTGIRVGAIVAKTMAFAAQLPLVGICTLEGLIRPEECNQAAIIDAKIGGIYALKPNQKPEIVPANQILHYLADTQLLITPKSHPLKTKLEALYPNQAWQWREQGPDPVQMGNLAWKKFQAQEVVTDNNLELLYLRETQAETERKQDEQEGFAAG